MDKGDKQTYVKRRSSNGHQIYEKHSMSLAMRET